MQAFFDDFCWRVPNAGYRWVEGRVESGSQADAPEPLLGRVDPTDVGQQVLQPFVEYPDLYLTFANTDPTPAGVLAFANRFGTLGPAVESKIIPGSVTGDDAAALSWSLGAEPYRLWRAHVLWLRHLITLWQSARQGDTDQLARWIVWDRRGLSYRVPRGVAACVTQVAPRWLFRPRPGQPRRLGYPGHSEFTMYNLGQTVARGDMASAAEIFVISAVNEKLSVTAAPQLYWSFLTRETSLHGYPQGLLDAMYLQFAWSIEGNRQYRQCPVCQKWFVLAPGVNRSNRLTCSAGCRVRQSRMRQDRARQLHAEGKSFREIAREIGSKVAKVKEWVRKQEE